MRSFYLAAVTAALALGVAAPASAHGIVGKRFFPATLTTEDPFIADELALPTISSFNDETEVSLEWGKRITSRLGVSVEGAWTHGDEGDGFQNIETGFKYLLHADDDHEAILSAGVDVEWGGSGGAPDAEAVSVIAPTLYFGRGFGDAPADWLKPFAVTGAIAYEIPEEAHATSESGDLEALPYSISYGVALEYSLPYFAANVRDHGWPTWVNQLTPMIELQIDQPVRQRGEERTTGTINPGIVWSGHRLQFGAEALIPINDESGDDVGFVVQAHYYLDDIFPRSLGRPLFGGQR